MIQKIKASQKDKIGQAWKIKIIINNKKIKNIIKVNIPKIPKIELDLKVQRRWKMGC